MNRVRTCIALFAALLNVGGGPVWAHASAAAVNTTEAATEMPADCAAHEGAQTAPDRAADSMPCCDTGDCHCAVPAGVLAVSTSLPPRIAPGTEAWVIDAAGHAPDPLDDDLRPPIR